MPTNLILFDHPALRGQLLPLTFTRPVCDIRIGIDTIREKWVRTTGVSVSCRTEAYLAGKFPLEAASDNLLVNGSLIPTDTLWNDLQQLKPGQGIYQNNILLAAHITGEAAATDTWEEIEGTLDKLEYKQPVFLIENLWDIYLKNKEALELDCKAITSGRKSAKADKTNILINEELIFIEPGAKVQGAILNASNGPIYIGADAEVMEGSLVRGPFALCEHSTLKMGAKIYGATTIGPHCKVGGEVNNSVIFGYTNKAHDGFLGNSVLGEWCNLGADTNNSNLKNNYGEVKIWSYPKGTQQDTGQQFCGLFMGDHSKSGINTMFNTGTVVGVMANVFGGDFPKKFIPSFSWGGDKGYTTYHLSKAYEVAERVMSRRGLELTKEDKEILRTIFEQTAIHRPKTTTT